MVIDPGPISETHLDALVAAIAGRPVSHILVTHAHLDHSPLAARLSQQIDAPVYAFGDALAGRSERMQALALAGDIGGTQGVDTAFSPDVLLADGEIISNSETTLIAHHTPGHFGNHLSFAWQNAVFTGDHVMGWASTMISPPDGDLADFRASCTKLKTLNAARFYAGHGAPINTPNTRLDWLLTHRQAREDQIFAALASGPANAPQIASQIYTDIPAALLPAAARNVLAHLIDLTDKSRIHPLGALRSETIFART